VKTEKNTKDWIFSAILFFLLLVTRPTGLLFVPVVGFFLWLKTFSTKNLLLMLLFPVLALGSFYLLLNYAMKGEGEFDFMKPFVEEHLICGVPGNTRTDIVTSANGNSVEGLASYLVNNFQQFSSLAIKKAGLFFGMTRSYYSTAHNIILQLFFYPLYLLGILGSTLGWKKNRFMISFCLATILIFTISVLLSCDDWLNRFIMPVLPLIILLAVTGIKELITKIKHQKQIQTVR
jgi:hypothetical protein